MVKSKTAAGICDACKYDPECIFEAGLSGTILQCEQFEMGYLQRPQPTAPDTKRNRAVAETNGYPGLCSNCLNRDTCIYPKPEGGVWRCEEYA